MIVLTENQEKCLCDWLPWEAFEYSEPQDSSDPSEMVLGQAGILKVRVKFGGAGRRYEVTPLRVALIPFEPS